MPGNDLHVIAAAALLVLVGLWVWFQSRQTVPQQTEELDLGEGVSVVPHPVLSDKELSLYNLIKLAVEDRYLVFAQVPVWTLIAVQTAEQSVRSRLLRKLALRRVDFALVHPGSRTAQKVVLLEGTEWLSESQRRRAALVGDVLKAAGIDVVRLDPAQPQSVSSLASALGCRDTDDDPLE